MARHVWDEPIDKNIPWDGNRNTNNLPVRGSRVEEFLKGSLNSKIGVLHYDATNNRYLAFTDEEERDKYVADPTLTHLVLGTFDAPFNYSAEITLQTPSYNAVFLNSTGNYIDFTFDIVNKQGSSTGENVTVTYTFIRNAHKKVVTETRRFGEAIHFNVDNYIETGTNTVIIGVMGQTTLAATTVAVTYQVVDLSLTDEVNVSNVYDLTKGAQTMEVFFTVSGYGVKTVEWFLDGVQLPFVKSEDEVVDVASSRTKYVTLSNLSSGVHTLQIRAYTVLNGEKFYTDTLYREVIVYNGDTTDNILALAVSLPHSHGVVTESNPLAFYGAEQYLPYEVRFATRKSAEVTILLGDTPLTTVEALAGKEMSHSVVSNKAGSFALTFVVGNVEREVSLVVETTSLNIEEITNALAFEFSARGRNNSAVDKDSWSYKEYVATFEGFNWNASSGWVNNALLINNGARFSINIAPLLTDATGVGKTLEFEFSTRNVEDDNAVVCDLTTNGTGLLITASGVKLTSAAGEVVDTKFKAGEVNRIAFVINRKNGVTYKGLAFVYVNGILSGAVSYGSADNFISSAQLSFIGTANAQVELRAMRFYNTALTSDNILNNYILYRDTLSEMLEVYYRNDVYAEGTQDFSPYAMLRRLPVMIITGDIPTLESATSTSTQVLVDIEYTNEQDPTKNFKMSNAALRIQGTSSLAYPRKNFRFYTKKEESTIVYDSEGKVISDKLYAFKDGAQPVDCWCLKADYAESSGTHNTGIACIWNNVLHSAIVQHKNILGEEVNGYVLRTNAQLSALASGYPYDVRTTIDGFPIALFYKRNASDTDLIFLGKYNFNNDKSTPSVFGFEGIPGFDNSRMQCWETKDNGHPLGLFTDISSFDADWSEAFESRYPDTKTPNTTDLKSFSLWINGVSQENFATEKWAHLDVYKVAAYYCYLMRFGAVDQPVKNGFITSEDGEHFYFINYDNDTINGLINTGELRLDPTINRQTIGSDGEYVYAGHNSVLWNKCEADSEFMDVVSIVDNALYVAGLRYDEVIKMFNEEQAAKWVERVYNQDAEYKYLLPFVNSSTDNLFMLQGSRSSHRSWWLSKRFALYDSLFVSGNYKDRNISFKCLNDTQPGQQFTITSGTDMNYGYGVNNGIREVGVHLPKGDSHTFTTTDTLNLGDVIKIFAAANLSELDVSPMGSRIAVFDCTASVDAALGSKLKRLILGGSSVSNSELSSISGIGVLTALQELNVEGYRNITYLDLTAQVDLRKVNTLRSRVASIDFAPGAPVERLDLTPLITLRLQQLPYITAGNVVMDFSNTKIVVVTGCPNITNQFSFVDNWLTTKTTADSLCELEMDNINWENVDVNKFLSFSNRKVNGLKMRLRGKVTLANVTLEQVATIQSIWGDDCFDENADFSISFPDMIYISPTEVTINEGESVQFTHTLYAFNEGKVTYEIASGSRTGVSLDRETGLLTTVENGTDTSTLSVKAVFTPINGDVIEDTANVTIKKRIYPTDSDITIEGATTLQQDETYSWVSTAVGVNGDMEATWGMTGTALTGGYLSIGETSTETCVLNFLKGAEPGQNITGVLTLTLKKRVDGTVVTTKSMSIKMVNYVYPTSENTTFEGEATPSTDTPVYSWVSTAEGLAGPIDVAYTLDEALTPYFEIASTEKVEGAFSGSCTLQKIKAVETFAEGNINVTITRVNTGESFTLGRVITLLNPDVIMTSATNPNVLRVLHNAGLCASPDYMLKSEAEAVKDGSFNPSGAQEGSIFYGTNITSFDEFRYFTGMTRLDDYAFYTKTNLASIKIPETIRHFGTWCFYALSRTVTLKIDRINVESVGESAFYSRSGNIEIEELNWSCEQAAVSSQYFYYAKIKRLNMSVLPGGSTGSTKAYFAYATIDKLILADGITSILAYTFYTNGIASMEIPDSVVRINSNAFSSSVVVDRFSENLTSIGASAFVYVTFRCDVNLSKLVGSIPTSPPWTSATFEGTLDISKATGNIALPMSRCTIKRLIAPEQVFTVSTSLSHKQDGIDELYIPNCVNFAQSGPTSNTQSASSLGAGAKKIFFKNLEGEYIDVTTLKCSDWGITSFNRSSFAFVSAIKRVDLTGVTNIEYAAFQGASIEELTLDNGGGSISLKEYCFSSTTALRQITDTSTQPWPSDGYFFSGVNPDVNVESEWFILCRLSAYPTVRLNGDRWASGDRMIRSGVDIRIELETGAYFSDNSRSKTIAFAKSNHIVHLGDILPYGYLTLNITTNKSDAQFKVDYTDINSGEVTSTTVTGGGGHILPIKVKTSITVTAITEYEGFIPEGAQTISSISAIYNATLNYRERTDIYIQHIDGTLYTTDEWTAGGYANDQANGVAVVCASTSFVTRAGYVYTGVWSSDMSNLVEGILTTSQLSEAITDFAGAANTALMLATDTSGAAYACNNYTFPNGAKGYLPALGEWNVVFLNMDMINAALTLIGLKGFTSYYYWSSTQVSATQVWHALSGNFYTQYKNDGSLQRACPFTSLNPIP